jgi:FkbM family methyltransferase
MEFPIMVKIKNLDQVEIKSYNAAYFISHITDHENVKYDIDDDVVLISKKNNNNENLQIIFHGGINNGDLIHSFLDSDYSNLPFQKKWVLDIGMNIGDSSIYFILNGATRVIGVEPFSKNFEFASKNVKENNFQDRIQLIKASCSSKSGQIKINEYEGVESSIEESDTGTQIQIMTLEDIIKKYNIPNNSILKMDCEGCEDEVISSIPTKVIRHFSDIQIEYHNGYEEIKKKIEKSGFDVKIIKPTSSNVLGNLFSRFTNQKLPKRKIGYVGFVFAKKREYQND